MRTRLFHTVVLVGTAMGASLSTVSCSGSDSGSGSCQGNACGTFPGISYVGDSGAHGDTFPGIRADGTASDTGSDTFPGIHADDADVDTQDAGDSDTFPGIAVDTGTDTFPGIMPADGGAFG